MRDSPTPTRPPRPPHPLRVASAAVIAGATDLVRAVVPVECAGCGLEDVPLCRACAEAFDEPIVEVGDAPGRLDVEGEALMPVWAAAWLDGPVHETVAAWKDAGRRDLDRRAHAWMRRVARESADGLPVRESLAIVPVPSRTRSRGADLPRLLARGAVAGLADAGVTASTRPCLRIGRGESRGAGQRARTRGASVRAVRSPGPGPVILIDDVVTSGATLRAAREACEQSGTPVLGALVLAAAPPLGSRADGGLQ